MDWFNAVFGFQEGSYSKTKRSFALEKDGDKYELISKANGKRFHVGTFEWPSVEELGAAFPLVGNVPTLDGGLVFSNTVGDVRKLHRDEANSGSVFQVASQFNCLEMAEPHLRPEDGVTIYANDRTQGPACALACPAATVFRNFFVNGKGQAGKNQLDMLRDVAEAMGNRKHKYWEMRNGYALPLTPWSLKELGARLLSDKALSQQARDKLRVGIHWSTDVLDCSHRVCQVYCSALPVAYARGVPSADWEPFATLVLEGAYDATLAAAALLSRRRSKRVTVYLTALGGGSFGNETRWIAAALGKILERYGGEALDVKLVHYMAIPDGGPFLELEQRLALKQESNASGQVRKRPSGSQQEPNASRQVRKRPSGPSSNVPARRIRTKRGI